jgi:ATP-binding cassette subfamily A (ABC1) protein 3
MEEAEAISDKLTIMVDGTYKCFGTLEDIKEGYGQSFDIELKFNK